MLQLAADYVKFNAPENLADLFYDEVSQKIFMVKSSVEGNSLKVTAKGPTATEPTVRFLLKRDADMAPLTMKMSPDRRIVAIQKDSNSVDFVRIVDKDPKSILETEFKYGCKAKRSRLLGFEWVTETEMVAVTDRGLETCLIQTDKKPSARNSKSINIPINWFTYCPENKLFLVSSGTLGNVLTPFYFKNHTLVRCAKFQVELSLTPNPPKLILLDKDVCIVTIYGVVCVLVLRHSVRTGERQGADIVVYELGRSERSLQNSANAPSVHFIARKFGILQLGCRGKFAIHAVDNLILVHNQSQQRTMVFDLAIRKAELAEPIYPILDSECIVRVRDPGRRERLFSTSTTDSHEASSGHASPSPVSPSFHTTEVAYSPHWVVLCPDLIIDGKMGRMWRLEINIDNPSSIASKFKDPKNLHKENTLLMLEFMIHRSGSKNAFQEAMRDRLQRGPPPPQPAPLLLPETQVIFEWVARSNLANAKKEGAPMSARKIDRSSTSSGSDIGKSSSTPALFLHFASTMSSGGQHSLLGSNESHSRLEHAGNASLIMTNRWHYTQDISQHGLYTTVFQPLLSRGDGSTEFLAEVLLRYILSLTKRSIDIQPFLAEALFTALVRTGDFNKLFQIMQHNVVTDSKSLAFFLLSIESKYPPALQLAVDMLRRLGTSQEELLEILISKGHVIEALHLSGLNNPLDPAIEAAENLQPPPNSDEIVTQWLKLIEAAWQHLDTHGKYTVFIAWLNRAEKLNIPLKGDKFYFYRSEFDKLWDDEEVKRSSNRVEFVCDQEF